jgi:hypothetical protein
MATPLYASRWWKPTRVRVGCHWRSDAGASARDRRPPAGVDDRRVQVLGALASPCRTSIEEMLRILIFVEFAERAPTRVDHTSQVELVSGHDRARDDGFPDASLIGGDMRMALVMLEGSKDCSAINVGGALQVWSTLLNGAQLSSRCRMAARSWWSKYPAGPPTKARQESPVR